MKNHSRPASNLLAVSLFTALFTSPLFAIPVRVLAWDADIASRKLGIADAKGFTPIADMHPSKRTKPYDVPLTDVPLTISALDKTLPDGKPCTVQIKVPATFKQPLLIILPDAKPAAGVRLFVLDDETATFSWGSMRFINATPKPLVFTCDKKVTPLPPSWTPLQVDPGGESRNVTVKLFYSDQPTQPIYASVWEQNPDIRKLIFLVPGDDPRFGPVAFKMIPEDRRVLASESAPKP